MKFFPSKGSLVKNWNKLETNHWVNQYSRKYCKRVYIYMIVLTLFCFRIHHKYHYHSMFSGEVNLQKFKELKNLFQMKRDKKHLRHVYLANRIGGIRNGSGNEYSWTPQTPITWVIISGRYLCEMTYRNETMSRLMPFY